MLEMIEVREVLYPDTPLYISVDSIVMIKESKQNEGHEPTSYITTANSMLYVYGDAKDFVTALTNDGVVLALELESPEE